MAVCSKCGNNVPDDAKFCSSCGQLVEAVPVVIEQPVPLVMEYQQETQPTADTPTPEPTYYTEPQAEIPEQTYYAPPQEQAPQQTYYAPPQGQAPQQSYYAPPQNQPPQQPNYYQQPNPGYQQPPMYQPGASDAAENKGLCVLSYLGILLLIPLLSKPNSQYVKFHSNQGLILLIVSILIGILSNIPILGTYIIGPFGSIGVLVMVIIGIMNTVNGQMKQLPLIGTFTLIK